MSSERDILYSALVQPKPMHKAETATHKESPTGHHNNPQHLFVLLFAALRFDGNPKALTTPQPPASSAPAWPCSRPFTTTTSRGRTETRTVLCCNACCRFAHVSPRAFSHPQQTSTPFLPCPEEAPHCRERGERAGRQAFHPSSPPASACLTSSPSRCCCTAPWTVPTRTCTRW